MSKLQAIFVAFAVLFFAYAAVAQTPGSTSVIGAASVEEIANALNALGARPKDLVAIFEAIQRAGALHAELVVM